MNPLRGCTVRTGVSRGGRSLRGWNDFIVGKALLPRHL